MATVKDWTAKAAEYILFEYPPPLERKKRQERIAAIIATFAEPLVTLLRQSVRTHRHDEDMYGAAWERGEKRQCCSRCTCNSWKGEDNAQAAGDDETDMEPNSDEPCTCGADEWNAKIDEALK